jgi:hypothetical protein
MKFLAQKSSELSFQNAVISGAQSRSQQQYASHEPSVMSQVQLPSALAVSVDFLAVSICEGKTVFSLWGRPKTKAVDVAKSESGFILFEFTRF